MDRAMVRKDAPVPVAATAPAPSRLQLATLEEWQAQPVDDAENVATCDVDDNR